METSHGLDQLSSLAIIRVGDYLPFIALKELRLVNATFNGAFSRVLSTRSKLVVEDGGPNKDLSKFMSIFSSNYAEKRKDDQMDILIPRNFVLRAATQGQTLLCSASFDRFNPFLELCGVHIRQVSCQLTWEQIPATNFVKFVSQLENLIELEISLIFPYQWTPVNFPGVKGNGMKSENKALPKLRQLSISYDKTRPGCGVSNYGVTGTRVLAYQNLVQALFQVLPSFEIIRYNAPNEPSISISNRNAYYDSYPEALAFFTACRPYLKAERWKNLIVDFSGSIEYTSNFEELFRLNNVRLRSLQIHVDHRALGVKRLDLVSKLDFHKETLQQLELYFHSMNAKHFKKHNDLFVLPKSFPALKTLQIEFASSFHTAFNDNETKLIMPKMDYDERFPQLQTLIISAPIDMMKQLCKRLFPGTPCTTLSSLKLCPHNVIKSSNRGNIIDMAEVEMLFPNLIFFDNGSGGRRLF